MEEQTTTGPDLKDCPFCAEPVKIMAKKCKHCGETIDVALRMAEEAKQASSINQSNSPIVVNNNNNNNNNNNPGGSVVVVDGKPQGSWIVLFLWALIFLPAAIVYFFMRRW